MLLHPTQLELHLEAHGANLNNLPSRDRGGHRCLLMTINAGKPHYVWLYKSEAEMLFTKIIHGEVVLSEWSMWDMGYFGRASFVMNEGKARLLSYTERSKGRVN